MLLKFRSLLYYSKLYKDFKRRRRVKTIAFVRVVGIADCANFCVGKKEQAGRIFYRLAAYFSSLRPAAKLGQFTVYTVFESCRAIEFNAWTLLLF